VIRAETRVTSWFLNAFVAEEKDMQTKEVNIGESAEDLELVAMSAVKKALEPLSGEARARVLGWVSSRFSLKSQAPSDVAKTPNVTDSDDDYSDIAEKDENTIRLICPDLKANSITDAAQRVAYVVCYLRRKILNEEKTPVKEVYQQIKEYGAHDTNTSRNIGKLRNLKNGEFCKLTKPAELEAKRIIEEIRNTSTTGKWTGAGKKSAKRKQKKSDSAK